MINQIRNISANKNYMKPLNLILCFTFLLSFKSSYSQLTPIGANLGIGYGCGNHLKAGGIDFVVGRYNDTRSWLSDKMETPRFFRGFNLAMDIYYPKGILDLEFVGRKCDVSAKGTSVAGEQKRDFRYRVNTWNFGYGKKMNSSKKGPLGSYLGVDFSTIIIKNYTRVYSTSGSAPEYQKINWDLSIGFSPFIQFVGNRFTAKIQYQWMMLEANYWDVNRAINPNTWSGDNYEANKGKTSSLGICVRYNLINNDKDKKSRNSCL